MTYDYYCPQCNLSFEVKKPMAEASQDERCPKCGLNARRRYTPTDFSFGWKLTDSSHERGNPDELERDI